MDYNIGIDIGGTGISAGVVSDGGELICTTSLPTPVGNTAILDCISSLIDKLMADYPKIKSIGIGVPGAVFPRNTVSFACNINMRSYPLGDLLFERYKIPVYLENDANCAALAEYMARDCSSLLMLTIGTGIGGAYIENGRMLTGHNGCALEVGHNVIVCGGKTCSCGRRGCFETYASTSALVSNISEYIAKNPLSLMAEISKKYGDCDARIIFDAMRENDGDAHEIYAQYIAYLACGITSLINIFQPEILAIGGAIANQGEALLAPIRAIVEAENYARTTNICTEIISAKYFGDAGIIGASLLHTMGENHANC